MIATFTKIKTPQWRIKDNNESTWLNHVCEVNWTIRGLDGIQGFLEKCWADTKPAKQMKIKEPKTGAKILATYSPSTVDMIAMIKNAPKKSKKNFGTEIDSKKLNFWAKYLGINSTTLPW